MLLSRDVSNEKFRTKIQRRKASLYILGAETAETKEIRHRINKAVAELGADVNVRQITDEKTIYSHGVAPIQTPAVVMAKYQLKSVELCRKLRRLKSGSKTCYERYFRYTARMPISL